VGRFLGSRVVELLVRPERVRYYQQQVTHAMSFPAILLFQAALPSEIPGYVLGLSRYPFGLYLAALALAELPYAAGAVFLGEGFLAREYWVMLVLGVTGIALTTWAFTHWHRTFSGQPPLAPVIAEAAHGTKHLELTG